MKANYEDKIPKSQSTVSLGNLYDMNQQLMAHEPIISDEARYIAGQQLEDWLMERFMQKYFMLLCHERRDYTVLNLNKQEALGRPNELISRCAREDIFECLDNRGDLLAAQLQEDGVWEFWIRTINNECAAYYLFPYGAAVIEY